MVSTSWLRRCSRLDVILGIGLLLLLANWWDSTRNRSWLACRWGAPHAHRGFGISTGEGEIVMWAGRPYQGLFGIHWTGFRFDRAQGDPDRRSIGPIYPASIDWNVADRPTLTVSFWTTVVCYMAVWACLMRWRHLQSVRVSKGISGAMLPELESSQVEQGAAGKPAVPARIGD